MPRKPRQRGPGTPAVDRVAGDVVRAVRAHLSEQLRVQSTAESYAEASRSPATRRAYRQSWDAFTAWCEQAGRQQRPASPDTVCDWAAALAAMGRRPSTIARQLAAISVAHQVAGLQSPTRTAAVRAVLAGIRRTHGTAPRGKAALETPALREAVSTLSKDTARGARDRALLLLGFAGGFRRSELTGLEVDDLEFVPEGLQVRLTRSKTDQEGLGRVVGIPYGLHEATCPVLAVQAWLRLAGAVAGPAFRTVDRAGRILSGRCSDRAVARAVQRAVHASGGDSSKVGAHSLRSGFVTSAARAGAPTWAIQNQTGHRSLSQLHAYVRPATLFQDNAARYVAM